MSDNAVQAAEHSLKRLQDFEPAKLVQRDKLGSELAFDDAVDPARKLVLLFKKLPIASLVEFPEAQLAEVVTLSDSVYQVFDQIMQFSPRVSDAESQRDSLQQRLVSVYEKTFSQLYPLISYGVARTVDFSSLETQARAALQSIADQREDLIASLSATSERANEILEQVRDAAAEQGVTQMAKYFSEESAIHERLASRWLYGVAGAVGVVVIYTGFSIWMPFIDSLAPRDSLQAAQIIASKVLGFVVLGYVLVQCVRSYSAHMHNAVTNKHRQNALMTFTTLANAANTSEARDSVLNHAAAAIYSPNDSGYLKGEERGYQGGSLIGVSPRSLFSAPTGSG